MTLDTTEVGLRSLVESLGGEIYWDNDTKTITVINGNIHCTYCKDESSDKYEKIYKDGQYDGRGRSDIIDGHTIAQPELYLYFCELFNALPREDHEKYIFYVIDDPYGI